MGKKSVVVLAVMMAIAILIVCTLTLKAKNDKSGIDFPQHKSVSKRTSSKRATYGDNTPPPWSPNPCPPTETCPTCPCPPPKSCPSCDDNAGFLKYGPASINDLTVSYTCPPGYVSKHDNKNRCVLPPNEAKKACLGDPNCLGLCINPGYDGDYALVNVNPSNSGPATTNIYLEKASK